MDKKQLKKEVTRVAAYKAGGLLARPHRERAFPRSCLIGWDTQPVQKTAEINKDTYGLNK